MNEQTPKYPEIVIDLENGRKNRNQMYLWVQQAFPEKNSIYWDWYEKCYYLDSHNQLIETMKWFSVINIFYTKN